MTAPKILILGTSYVGEGAQGYSSKLVTLWAELHAKINPGIDVLLIDSASPTSPGKFLRPLGFEHSTITDDVAEQCQGIDRLVLTWRDNLGHLNTSGRDGWGRSLSQGIELAIKWEYDIIAYQDSDIICTQPVAPIAKKMWDIGVLAACPFDTTYSFLENGLMWLDVAYLKQSDFVGRYDWKSRTRTNDPMQIPEILFEKLLADVLFTLPLRGLRNDFDRLTVNNLPVFFPYGGPNYLTHCKDFVIYERMLEMQGIFL